MPSHYETISPALEQQIIENQRNGYVSPYACKNESVIRRENRASDTPKIYRPPFSKDADKILNSLYYNRYADKTQVFSFFRNDDLSRRALHVQLVSRIARNIGSVLGLNTDLIEAIAIGHDMGHTPFGHAGERALHDLYYARTGRCFRHNLHGIRVLDTIVPYNISLQTLDGILCHNGEMPKEEYTPHEIKDFAVFDARTDACIRDLNGDKKLIPCTLEGCLVRICDMLAYLGKDRQDAVRAHLVESEECFSKTAIGSTNAEIINNLEVNLIENSYGKPYLRFDDVHFQAMLQLKKENYEMIYMKEPVQQQVKESIVPMMEQIYEKILADAKNRNKDSALYLHHIAPIEEKQRWYPAKQHYTDSDPNDLTMDFIAAMTDDYFVDYYRQLFPKSNYNICYTGYFDT